MATLLEAKSKFQRIKIEEDQMHTGDWILYLDDYFQLSTFSEFKYHESLITIPMCAAPSIDRVLICGAGDGMSLREALKFPYCRPVMAELDPGMIEIFRDMPQFSKYNNNSMKDPRAAVWTGDAVNYMETCKQNGTKFNCIFWDFPGIPDINPSELNLFSVKNLNLMMDLLPSYGVFATHISIPVPITVKMIKTLRARGYTCWTYDAYYDFSGNYDTFLVASQCQLNKVRPVPDSCRWANNDRVRVAFSKSTEVIPEDDEYFTHFLGLDDIEQ